MNEIKPALTAEEEIVAALRVLGALGSLYADAPDHHTVIARSGGEPGKIGLYVEVTVGDLRRARMAADRIAALLPPREPQPNP